MQRIPISVPLPLRWQLIGIIAVIGAVREGQCGPDSTHLVPQGEEPESIVGPRLPDAPIRRRFEKPNPGLLMGDEGGMLQRNSPVSPHGDLPGFRHVLPRKGLKGRQSRTGVGTEHPKGLRRQRPGLHVGVVRHHGLQVGKRRLDELGHLAAVRTVRRRDPASWLSTVVSNVGHSKVVTIEKSLQHGAETTQQHPAKGVCSGDHE